MKRLDQLAKGISNTRKEAALNTRQYQTNFPLVERKLDILSNNNSYTLEFPLTKTNHSALLTINIKPDNCCECEPGAATTGRDCEGYFKAESFGPPDALDYEFNKPYPAIYEGDATPAWEYNVWEPTTTRTHMGLIQTGANFNYGYQSPFVVPIYQPFDDIAGYSIAPNGRIKIPTDGVYSVLFQCTIGGTAMSDAAFFTQSIRVDRSDAYPLIETLSKKIYSVANNKLSFPTNSILYATCVNLYQGDTVAGWVEINDIAGFSVGSGWGDEQNNTHINLLGVGYGYLIGHVYDIASGTPLTGVAMSFSNLFGGHATTDEFGGYGFYSLAPGTYSVTATYDGYITQTQSATVSFNNITELDYNLTGGG